MGSPSARIQPLLDLDLISLFPSSARKGGYVGGRVFTGGDEAARRAHQTTGQKERRGPGKEATALEAVLMGC